MRPGYRGIAPGGLGQVRRLAGWGAVRMPVVDVVPVGVVALHALPRAPLATVGDDFVTAVQDVDLPAQLVVLAAVGDVTGRNGESELHPGHRAGTHRVDRSGHGLGDLRGEHLLRPVGGVEGRVRARRVADAVGVFHSQRRLGVDDVHVGDLGEGQQRCSPAVPAGLRLDAEVGAHQVGLAGGAQQRHVAALAGFAAQQRLLDGRDRCRPGATRRRPARVPGTRGASADTAEGANGGGCCTAFQQIASGESHGSLRNGPRPDARAADDTLVSARPAVSSGAG